MGMRSDFVAPLAYDSIEGAIKPRNDNVLIRWVTRDETAPVSSWIELPDRAPDKTQAREALVVAVGPGPAYRKNCECCGQPVGPHEMQCKPGMRILVDSGEPGEILYVDGIEHRMIRDENALAEVEGALG